MKIVDVEAAEIPGIPRHKVIAIKARHDMICKFESKEQGYKEVIGELRTLAEVKPTNTGPAVSILPATSKYVCLQGLRHQW